MHLYYMLVPKNGHLNITNCVDPVADRPVWRCTIHQAPAYFDTDRLLNEAEKQQGGKENEMN